ncbi:MAG TPA: ABC transporter permease subunit [Thermoanaerobaculia bacterium]|nr:ABC transporter permease subunit [Thermoanaerobaculia bacterium]
MSGHPPLPSTDLPAAGHRPEATRSSDPPGPGAIGKRETGADAWMRFAPALLALLLAWLVGYPLLLTFAEAFHGPSGWTGRFFLQFFARPDEWLALWRSLWISLASVVLAAVVGIPLAFIFERAEFPGRRLLGAVAALPVALPPLVGVIAFLFLYGESGFVSRAVQALLRLDHAPWQLAGPGAILLVHTYSFYVYFYLFARAGLARQDAALLEAAASLGAGGGRRLWRVTLPLLRPALVTAALLTFMTALASFSAPYLFGGGFRVMPTQILASKLNGDRPMSRVETVMLAAVALAGLWASQRAGAGSAPASGLRGVAPARRRVGSPLTRGAVAAAGYALALVLLLPHLVMILISLVPVWTWNAEPFPPVLNLGNYAQLGDRVHLLPIVNSLWMAAAATAAAVALGLAAALAAAGPKAGLAPIGGGAATGRRRRRRRPRLGGVLEALVGLPWAIPGTVFAIALATTFSVDAPWMGRFVLIGTPVLLPLAYLVRSLPLTGRAAIGGLRGMDPALAEAAAALGAGRLRTLRRIILPQLRPALAAGAGLAFITALGDFVTSIVLYTYDTRPISIEILANVNLQDLGMGAVYGVLLMAGSAAAFFLWSPAEGRLGS